MGKDARLANIYIKIHNKYTLTLEDLKFLSKYDPECFEKTCKNIVYKMPETKKILQPETQSSIQSKNEEAPRTKAEKAPEPGKQEPKKESAVFEEPPADKQRIEAVLSNLKRMERKDLPVGEIRVDQVKELLGNLYMELLFPHNDRDKYFNMEDQEELSVFNKKI